MTPVSKQRGLEAERRARFGEAAVERAKGRAMIGANREVQSIAGAETERMVIRKSGRSAEIVAPIPAES